VSVNQEIALSILAAVGVLGLLTLLSVYLIIGIAWQEFQRSGAGRDPSEPMPTGFALVKNALVLRCPRCRRGRINSSLIRMNQGCRVCGVVFWKNEGEWLGPAVINYSVALISALAAWAVTVLLNCSAALQIILSAVATGATVIAVAPWSRSFWTLFLYLNGELEAPTDDPRKQPSPSSRA
jgi:uncharacterized protein (DUF983 family)